jgi:hypothetical protein
MVKTNIIKESSDNFDYEFYGHYRKDHVSDFVNTQEDDIAKISNFLGLKKVHARFKYKVYPTIGEKRKADPYHSGSYACARFGEKTIYRVLGDGMPNLSFPHEIVHLVMHQISPTYYWEVELDTFDGKKKKKVIAMDSTSYLQEGIALLIDELVFNNKLREAGEYRFLDEWVHYNKGKHDIHIKDQIDFYEFCACNPIHGTPMCGSFCMYLVKKYGLSKFLELYKGSSELLKKEKNILLIESAYGKSLDKLEKEWLKSI